jgi:transcriptional regulator with XRE-family HTH domain
MDFDRVAAEFLRALRGRRSQAAFCRRLGYKSNVSYTWESGRGFPTAAQAFAIARKMGVDLEAALQRFYVVPPPWLEHTDVATKPGVAALLRDLRGETTLVELARSSDKTRFAISRWLKAESEPRLNEFFQLVECLSLRLVDLIETLVDPESMPSIRERWQSMVVARRLAYDAPWTQAVLRALELEEYRRLARPPPGWIARRIGIDAAEERRCLELLDRAGQIRKSRDRWELVEAMALDVRKDPEAAARLRAFWGQVAAHRSEQGRRGTMYTVCGVSARDLGRLRELQKAYFNQVRTIIAQSQPVERVVLTMVQMLDLGEGEPPSPGPDAQPAPAGRSPRAGSGRAAPRASRTRG